jgi:hypothetical protein
MSARFQIIKLRTAPRNVEPAIGVRRLCAASNGFASASTVVGGRVAPPGVVLRFAIDPAGLKPESMATRPGRSQVDARLADRSETCWLSRSDFWREAKAPAIGLQ